MESDPVIFGIEDEPDVISARKLDKRLAEAGSDVTALRDVLAWGRDLVSTNFYAGVSAHALVRANTRLIDQTLAHVWAQTLGDAAARLALVAVGGYGRAELLPHSDIDLLVLYPDEGLGSADQVLEQFLTMLWDLRLNVGHSVRSAKECREQAGADITIMTNLMEARLLDLITSQHQEHLRLQRGKHQKTFLSQHSLMHLMKIMKQPISFSLMQRMQRSQIIQLSSQLLMMMIRRIYLSLISLQMMNQRVMHPSRSVFHLLLQKRSPLITPPLMVRQFQALIMSKHLEH